MSKIFPAARSAYEKSYSCFKNASRSRVHGFRREHQEKISRRVHPRRDSHRRECEHRAQEFYLDHGLMAAARRAALRHAREQRKAHRRTQGRRHCAARIPVHDPHRAARPRHARIRAFDSRRDRLDSRQKDRGGEDDRCSRAHESSCPPARRKGHKAAAHRSKRRVGNA